MEFDARTGEIRQAIEQRRADDTKIMQKVNAVHREAFTAKYPGQIEHCLRLVAERLQTGLKKDSDSALSNEDVYYLAQSLNILHWINIDNAN
jgi:hypothetical protein